MVFYLRRHIDVLFDRDAFLKTLRGGDTVYAVLSATDYAALGPRIGVPTCVLERESTVNVKLKAVLAREPLPEVLLITNKCECEIYGSAGSTGSLTQFYRFERFLPSSVSTRFCGGSLTNFVEPDEPCRTS